MAKNEAMEFIKCFYENKEKQLLEEIDEQDKKNQLHCPYRFGILKNGINKEISTVISTSQEIEEDNFLIELNRLKNEVLVNAQRKILEVENEVKMNECYVTSIFYNKGVFQELENVLNRAIGVTIKIDPNVIVQQSVNSQEQRTQRVSKIEQFAKHGNENIRSGNENDMRRPNSSSTLKNTPKNETDFINLFQGNNYLAGIQKQSQSKQSGNNGYILQKVNRNRFSLDSTNKKQESFFNDKSMDTERQGRNVNSPPMKDYNDMREMRNNLMDKQSHATVKNYQVAKEPKISVSQISEKYFTPSLKLKTEPWETADFRMNKIDKIGDLENIDISERNRNERNEDKSDRFDKEKNPRSNIELLTSFDSYIEPNQ